MRYKLNLSIGTQVIVNDIPHWLSHRIELGYCHLDPPCKGIVIGYTGDGDKIAVQLDNTIWTLKENGLRSRYDNGCHGKGPLGKCAYFLPDHILVIDPRFDHLTGEWTNITITHTSDSELLLILY